MLHLIDFSQNNQKQGHDDLNYKVIIWKRDVMCTFYHHLVNQKLKTINFTNSNVVMPQNNM